MGDRVGVGDRVGDAADAYNISLGVSVEGGQRTELGLEGERMGPHCRNGE